MSSEQPISKLANEPDALAGDPFDFTVDSPRSNVSDSHKSSYSLLLLFYITTVAAILAAVCRLAFVDTDLKANIVIRGYLVTGALSVVMGMVLGHFIGRTWISKLLGLLAGTITGLVGILMIFVQPIHAGNAALVLCSGCWVLSIIAIASNRWRK